MFNAPENAVGVVTSGGTESILMACLSARNRAYSKRGITDPEMLVWSCWLKSMHPADSILGFFQKPRIRPFLKLVNTSKSAYI